MNETNEPAIARVVRQMADAMRQPYSIAFALQKRGLCSSWSEASRVVLKYYPWP